MDLILSELGEVKVQPTLMFISCTFKTENNSAKEGILILSDVVNTFVNKVNTIEKVSAKTGKLLTNSVYKSVESTKGTIVKKTECGKVFSHFDSSQVVTIESALDLNTLIWVLELLTSNVYISRYDFSFDVSEEDRKALLTEAIKNAYSKACEKADVFVGLLQAGGYCIKEARISNNRYGCFNQNHMLCEDSVLFSDDFSRVKENIEIPDITVSSSIDFVIEIKE